ncbi:UNVERIFIED_CONTAM: hypothetical protein RMT77_007575 [Armadillidium vulgare]
MNLNPQFNQIGKTFVEQYYELFDGPRENREKLAIFYHAELSLMSFEGVQVQGAVNIVEKIKNLTFQKIQRMITAIDCQPTFDGGVLINVLGQLKMDDDPPHGFNQTFILKPLGDSFFVQHDMFRLALHHIAI